MIDFYLLLGVAGLHQQITCRLVHSSFLLTLQTLIKSIKHSRVLAAAFVNSIL